MLKRRIAIIIIGLLLFGYLCITSPVLAASSAKPAYSVFVSGNVTLNKADSYARVILTDIQGKEYLVYEASGPFDSGSFSFTTACEETCVLDGI
ncbi:hypothetical protein KJ616_02625, partial [Patescibacteria group bacterium]|nr:hypothetical protein [Patescibacteria group bacterium]